MVRRSALASFARDVQERPDIVEEQQPGRPFRILVLGDFGGRANRGLFDPSWEGRRALLVDSASLEEAITQIAPELEFAAGAADFENISVPFRELADFENDCLRLHNEDFEALKAAWCGVAFLAGIAEPWSAVELYLLDVSKAELGASLVFCEDVAESAAYREVVRTGAGWAVVAGLYVFDSGPQDQATLARMAQVARSANTPFLAQAAARLSGMQTEFSARPEALPKVSAVRRRDEARWLGLVSPGFLLRQHAGKPVLWGNPALACAAMLAQAFAANGWELRPPAPATVRVPYAGVPPASATEYAIGDHEADAALACGIMPLLACPDERSVLIPRFQSFAEPAAPLAGPWP